MLYKLWHKLFGRDYVYWNNGKGSGVSRVFNTLDGTTFYWQYKSTKVLGKVTRPSEVVWLTCSSDKYLKTRVA